MPENATFPQIPEAEATGATASIYADLRRTTGVPTVNLIWRHFAALPGTLDLVWRSLAPLLGSAELDAARNRIAESVPLPQCGPVSPAASGLSHQDVSQIQTIVAAYNLGNLTNIVALTALRLRLEQPELPDRALPFQPNPAPSLPQLPPLPGLATLPDPVAASVHVLAAKHEGAGAGVIPSLYLALSPWPSLLQALPHWLEPLYTPDTLRAARRHVVAAAEAEAAAMLPSLPSEPGHLNDARAALRRFTTLVIPDLIPVGLALRSLLQAPA